MAERMRERLYVKELGTERLRKGSAGRLRYLLSTGWREIDRSSSASYIAVQLEREGPGPERTPVAPPRPRPPRDGGARPNQRRGGPGPR